MATQVQFRGGTTAQNNAFTGASKEITVDTDKDVVVVHDGTTAGGHPLMAEDGSNSRLALGSAGVPALKFTDTNTGIYSPGADQIALSTGGAGRLFIDSLGRVGINTTSPDTLLDVSSSDNTYVTVQSTGNDKNALTYYKTGQVASSGFYVGLNASEEAMVWQTENNSIRFGTNNTDVMQINSSGNLGVGESNPDQRLHVKTSSDDVIKLESTSGGNGPNLTFAHTGASPADNDVTAKLTFNATNDAAQGTTFADIKVITTDVSDGSEDGAFAFSTRNNGTFAERVRIDSSGKVGIGDDSPDALLVIKGNSDSATTPSIRLKDGTDTREAWITNSAGDLSLNVGGNDNVAHGTLKMFDSGILDYAQGASSRLRVDTSGRLLVGTSSSLNTAYKLQIAGETDAAANVACFRGNATGQALLALTKSRTGTIGNHTIVQDDDNIGGIQFRASDGTNYITGASIETEVDGTPGTNDMPSRLVFSTTADGASAPTTRMTIKNDGTINFANVQAFADDAAAGAGGLSSGDVYKTSAGDLKIKA